MEMTMLEKRTHPIQPTRGVFREGYFWGDWLFVFQPGFVAFAASVAFVGVWLL
jgi:hypothetical protein